MAYSITKLHGSYNRKARTAKVKYIVVHYTGSGTSAKGAAKANCQYFGRANRDASAHYFIDDGSIYEYADPEDYYTWHCGDGHGKYGISNSNSIGIEVCINGNKPYTDAEIDRLTWLVQKLMKQFDVDADHVVRHYDASRKACPYYYTPSGKGGNSAWKKLHATITGGKSTGSDSTGAKTYTVYEATAENGLNCREGAGTKYAKTRVIEKGNHVSVKSVSNGWAKTKQGDYCSTKYLKKSTSKPYVVTAENGLNFRTGAGTDYKVNRVVKEGVRVGVVTVNSKGWALSSKGDWANSKYLHKLTKKTVKADGGLNCRKGPGTKYAKTRTLKDGSTVYIRSTSGGWAETQKGDWCSAKYLE